MTAPATPPRGGTTIASSVTPIDWAVSDAESLLRSLPGVISAKVVKHESGGIKEIHLLATTEHAPKQVVRNVESAMLARFGAHVDHRAVSVARSAEEARESPAAVLADSSSDTPGRGVYFEDVEARRSRKHGLSCTVTLRAGSGRYSGEASGAESARARGELAATATVNALQSLLAENVTLAFESCITVEATDRAFAFVVVSGRAGRDTTFLSGSCEVKDSLETAAVLAVLDATERWIERGTTR
jgi:hypothetical protein